MGPIYVPQLLDAKERFLLFYLYEILIFVVIGFGSYYIGQRSVGVVLALICFFGARYARRKGWLKDIYATIYWYCPPNITELITKTDKVPPSFKRELVG